MTRTTRTFSSTEESTCRCRARESSSTWMTGSGRTRIRPRVINPSWLKSAWILRHWCSWCRPDGPAHHDAERREGAHAFLSLALRDGEDFDAADAGIADNGRELDVDGTAAVGSHGEVLVDRLVLRSCGGDDVEVGQHLRAVDGDVEDALPRKVDVILGEVQPYQVLRVRRQVRNRIRKIT